MDRVGTKKHHRSLEPTYVAQHDHERRVLHALRQLNRLLISSTSSDRLVEQICSLLTGQLCYHRAWIVLLAQEDASGISGASLVDSPFVAKFRSLAHSGMSPELGESLRQRMQSGDFPRCIQNALKNQNPHVARNPECDCPECLLNKSYCSQSALTVPLIHQDLLFGVISVAIPEEFLGENDESTVFRELAADLSFALYKLDREQRAQQLSGIYTALFQNNLSVMLLMDSNTGVIVEANDAAVTFYGWEKSNLLGKTFYELNVLSRHLVQEELHQARNSKRNNFRFQHYLADGSTRYVDVFCGPVEIGNQNLLYAVVYDVTERVHAEAAIIQAKSKLQAILNASFDAIFLSQHGRILESNRTASALFGYTEKEFTSLHANQLFHPSDQRLITSNIQLQFEGIYEAVGMRKDGSTFQAEIQARMIDLDGTSRRMTAIRDITLRRQAETELRNSVRLQELIAELSTSFISLPVEQFESTLQNSLQKIAHYSGAVRTYVGHYDHQARQCRFTHEWHADFVSSLKETQPIVPFETIENSWLKQHLRDVAFLETDALGIHHIEKLRFLHLVKGANVYILLPLMEGDTPFGFVGFDFIRTNTILQDGERKIFEIFAHMVANIFKRRMMEDNLRQERERLEFIITGSQLGTWIWDVQSNWTVFNERWAGMLGYSLEELTPYDYNTWENLVHPDDLDETLLALQHATSGASQGFDIEFRMRHKEGHWVWIHDRGQVLTHDSNGKPHMMFGTHADITWRKRDEEQLRLLAYQVEQAPIAMIRADVERNVEWCNEQFTATTGFTLEDIRGQKVGDFLQGPGTNQANVALMRAQLDALNPVHLEILNYTKSNQPYWAELTIVPLRDAKDHHIGFVGYSRNITERVEAAQKLQDVTESLRKLNEELESRVTQRTLELQKKTTTLELSLETGQIGTWSIKIDENKVYWDERMFLLYGQNKEKFVPTFESWCALLEPEDLNRVLPLYEKAIRECSSFEFRYGLKKPSGEQIIIQAKGLYHFNPLTEEAIIHGINYDITTVVAREQALEEINRQLAEATRQKDEFLANMSHDLRTPLNSILGMCESLEMGTYSSLNHKQSKAIFRIRESGNHLLSIINDLLDLAKMEAGRMRLQYSTLNSRELAREAIQMMEGLAKEKHLNLGLEPQADVVLFQGDPLRLKQVLINLLSNSIKFTEPGGTISLGVQSKVSDGTVSFCIRDNGIGIHPDFQQYLFKPFFQAETSLVKRHSGTGLGLSIVKHLTELHGGWITYQTSEGKGTTFTITLPLSGLPA
ncbi:MAG: PAS domain S-box protein [Candidatus Sumerlaeia bacterium]|nr:PAS domain S-box protein [Candidatus Sumerlaeia bacterium]